jgi:translation initiation factor IF-2
MGGTRDAGHGRGGAAGGGGLRRGGGCAVGALRAAIPCDCGGSARVYRHSAPEPAPPAAAPPAAGRPAVAAPAPAPARGCPPRPALPSRRAARRVPCAAWSAQPRAVRCSPSTPPQAPEACSGRATSPHKDPPAPWQALPGSAAPDPGARSPAAGAPARPPATGPPSERLSAPGTRPQGTRTPRHPDMQDRRGPHSGGQAPASHQGQGPLRVGGAAHKGRGAVHRGVCAYGDNGGARPRGPFWG